MSSKGIYTEKERNERIKKELTRIKSAFKDLDEFRIVALDRLLYEAAFLSTTLDETKQMINRDGITEKYTNGANQCGYKKSSAVEVYDKFIASYTKIIAQLTKELPDAASKNKAADAINDFLEGE